MTLAINSQAMLKAWIYTATYSYRRAEAAAYLTRRVQRVCEHEYSTPLKLPGGVFAYCALCGHEIEHGYDF